MPRARQEGTPGPETNHHAVTSNVKTPPRHVWFWSLMVNTVMDSLYVMLSGIAKDGSRADENMCP